jgi:hypothetical protein
MIGNAILLAVPVLLGGYGLLGAAALTGATILAWDGAHLFLDGSTSQHVVHQRHYATSVARAVTWLTGVLVALVVSGIVVAAAVACLV